MAGDASDQVLVEYLIIPYTSTSVRSPHLCQRYHDHFVVVTNMGGMGKLGMVHLCQDLDGATWGVGYHISIFCSVFVLLSIVLS